MILLYEWTATGVCVCVCVCVRVWLRYDHCQYTRCALTVWWPALAIFVPSFGSPHHP